MTDKTEKGGSAAKAAPEAESKGSAAAKAPEAAAPKSTGNQIAQVIESETRRLLAALPESARQKGAEILENTTAVAAKAMAGQDVTRELAQLKAQQLNVAAEHASYFRDGVGNMLARIGHVLVAALAGA